MIELHYWTTPNGDNITIFLEKSGLPHRIVLSDNREHQVGLEKLDVMFAAGPMANPDGAPAGDLIVIRARDSRKQRRSSIPILSKSVTSSAANIVTGVPRGAGR